jgi:hypothetical protein
MTRLILLVLSLMILPAMAREQDHTCQGGHNCNQGGGDGTVTVDVDASAGAIAGAKSDADASATGGEGGSATTTNNLSIFDLGGGVGGEGGGTDTTGGEDGTVDGLASGTSILSPSTSVTTTTTNKYKEAPRAYAGSAAAVKDIDCRNIYGFDFRGATDDGAGGATFGIPGRERKDCKYERQAARAFAKGDLERGWANHCMSPTNLEATMMVARVVYHEQLDEDGAFKRCMLNAQIAVPGNPSDLAGLLADANEVIEAQKEEYEVLEERVQQVEQKLQKERSASHQQQQVQQQQYDEGAYRRSRALENLMKAEKSDG